MRSRGLVGIAAAAIALTTWCGPLHAGDHFSVASLNGSYGFSGSGTIGFGRFAAAVVGTTSYDGAGGCSVTARLNATGILIPLTTATCSYTVDPDGTGTLNVVLNEGLTFISSFVILDGGKEQHFVLTDPFNSTVANGTAMKQSSGAAEQQ
jgi:hypothetical protein